MIDLLIATQSTTAGSTPAWLSAGASAAAVILTIIVLLVTVGRNVATKSDVNDARAKNEQAINNVKDDLEGRLDRLDDKIDRLKTEVVRAMATTVGIVLERRSHARQEETDPGSPTSDGPEHTPDEKAH